MSCGIGKKRLKYIHPDGREAVFDGDTLEVITDPLYVGTFNYCVPQGAVKNYIGHFNEDMQPYYDTGYSNTRQQYEEKLKIWEDIERSGFNAFM